MDTKTKYEKEGFLHIPNLLTMEEALSYRAKFQRIAGLKDEDFAKTQNGLKGWSMNDAVTQLPECWPLIFHERLLSTVREILGPQIRYTQHSDLHVNFASIGWHRDSACRKFKKGADWNVNSEAYAVVRVAVYFQSFAESGFKLGVIPGSHRWESTLTRMELKAWSAMGKVLKKGRMAAPLLTVPTQWLPIEIGDCVIFNQRLLHSGSPIHGPKYSVYFSYGLDNVHSRNHVKYYFFTRSELNYRPPPASLEARLKEQNLYLDF